jgi:hypothetical protein
LTPFPHTGWQSLSFVWFAPTGQQPSFAADVRITSCVHWTEQPLPVMPSLVHANKSPHVAAVGQRPSQRSPASTILLPQIGSQSLSLLAFAPLGQQPSSFFGAVIGTFVHALLQLFALPVSRSVVQALPSSQVVGQGICALFGSHTSPASIVPLPQLAEQSLSVAFVHVEGQQPSPDMHSTIGCMLHCAVHAAASPSTTAFKQAFNDTHVAAVGHISTGSHASPASIEPLPQLERQSVSLFASAPSGQQPSPESNSVIVEGVQRV